MGKLKGHSRRKFIRNIGCAALGSTGFYSSIFNLQALSEAALNNSLNALNNDYKALVCIMLRGGNDAFNMLIPHTDTHYSDYALQRSNLAIDRSDLLTLDPLNYNDKTLALHPSMPKIKSLFDSEKMAFVCNVGTLIQPMSKNDVINGGQLPSGLFSHSDQAHHWQTSVPQSNSATGWAGRMADLVMSANSNDQISMNISLAGKNVFQLGNDASEYSIRSTGNGSIGISGYQGNSLFDQLRTSLVDSLMEKQYQDIFKQSYADIVQSSQNAHSLFSSAIENSDITTEFSDTGISQDLKMVALTIQVREQLGMKRQTFFVQFDGWDHHDDLVELQEDMLKELDDALFEFQSALEEMGIDENVCTFTISDFGRTLGSNGNGSDHAWAGHVMAMGSSVKGRDIYGRYPDLRSSDALFLDGGVILPNISTDEYFAELALWFGVSPTDLAYIFPNIGNFYNTMSGIPPIGFMKAGN